MDDTISIQTRPSAALSVESAAALRHGPAIARPMGSMERSMWIFDQASPFNMGSAIDIHGRVCDDDLRLVLRACQDRHPQLRSIVRIDSNGPNFACFSPETAPEIPLRIDTGSEAERDRIATEELRERFDGYRTLMIRVRLVRFSQEHCALFVTFQHLIGDGFAAASLLLEIVTHLGVLSEGGSLPSRSSLPFPPTLEQGLPKRFRGWRGLWNMVRCQSKTTGKLRKLGDMPTPLRNDASVEFGERLPVVESFAFSREETQSLIAAAKREKVTLYALLVAVTLDAIHPFLADSEKFKNSPERVITMPIPTNLRPFLANHQESDFGFFSGSMDVVRKLSPENDIAEMARELRGELRTGIRRNSPPLFVMSTIAAVMDWNWIFPNSSRGIDRAARFIGSMAKHSSTSLTFLNNQKMPTKAGQLRLTNARGYIAPSMLGTALFSSVLFDGILSIQLNYNERQFSSDDAVMLKTRFRETALEFADGASLTSD